MTLKELYDQTPVENHGNIVIQEARVLVLDPMGSTEYAREGDELYLVRSEKAVNQAIAAIVADLQAIKTKLGI